MTEETKNIDYKNLQEKAIARPLVEHIYTADPSAHVFEGRIYIYPSHDIDAGEAFDDLGSHFDMQDYHVLSMDMDKGVAVETLANIVGVKHDEIMIVGNDFNDIPMFEKDFGIRLAVGDCPDDLLERCTHQIDDVHVLHRFLESHFL